MADWIRVNARLPECIEVSRIVDETDVEPATVIGRLFLAWRWADQHSHDGFIKHGELSWLTKLFGGDEAFWKSVERVGWLKVKSGGLLFPDRGRKKNRRIPSETDGTIYYIATHVEDVVKIGFTAAGIGVRLQELQTGSPILLKIVACHPGTMRDEKSLHKRFAHLRHIGEWFTYGKEIREWIASLASEGR